MFVVGIDFGTLSARAVVVSTDDGTVVGTATHDYAHGVIDRAPPRHGRGAAAARGRSRIPADWLEALWTAVPAAIAAAGIDPADGRRSRHRLHRPPPRSRCSATGRRSASSTRFAGRPHAYPKLWKHHAAQEQAERVTAVAAERGEPWLARYGGRISSEWQFAKALQVLDEDVEVYAAAERWIEAADWIVWQLCGVETRGVGVAGYKGQHQEGRYPSEAYLNALNPGLRRLRRAESSHCRSRRSARAPADSRPTPPDASACARGSRSPSGTSTRTSPRRRPARSSPATCSRVMGTSTCHVMNGDVLAEVPGMCGVVEGGITPGLLGYEAGQSGVGDIFAWFVEQQLPARYPTRPPGAVTTHTSTSPSSRPRRRPASTGSSRSTGTAATAPCSSTTS